MLYWTELEKVGKVYVEAKTRDAAWQLAQTMANEGGGPAYSVDVNLVQFPGLQTVTLIRADGTRETVEWRPAESYEVRAVRKALAGSGEHD